MPSRRQAILPACAGKRRGEIGRAVRGHRRERARGADDGGVEGDVAAIGLGIEVVAVEPHQRRRALRARQQRQHVGIAAPPEEIEPAAREQRRDAPAEDRARQQRVELAPGAAEDPEPLRVEPRVIGARMARQPRQRARPRPGRQDGVGAREDRRDHRHRGRHARIGIGAVRDPRRDMDLVEMPREHLELEQLPFVDPVVRIALGEHHQPAHGSSTPISVSRSIGWRRWSQPFQPRAQGERA